MEISVSPTQGKFEIRALLSPRLGGRLEKFSSLLPPLPPIVPPTTSLLDLHTLELLDTMLVSLTFAFLPRSLFRRRFSPLSLSSDFDASSHHFLPNQASALATRTRLEYSAI